MTKTCGNCYFFKVDTGKNGGKLKRPYAPGECTHKVEFPVLPASFDRNPWNQRAMWPVKHKVNSNQCHPPCPTWHTAEKQPVQTVGEYMRRELLAEQRELLG